MRIIIIQGAFLPVPPFLGGACEKMWFALGKEFAKQGHEVIHISRSYKDLPAFEIIDGVTHMRIKGYDTPPNGIWLKWLDLLYSIKVIKVIPKNIDIIISNTFWLPILLQKNLAKKTMVDVQRMPKGQIKFYLKVGKLRANSSPVKQAISKEIPNSKKEIITLIPNPLPFKVSSNLNLLEKEHLILYTGRIHPEKGLKLLIQAYSNLNTNWKLLIIGPSQINAGGGGSSYLEKLKSISGKNIHYIDPIYDSDKLNDYYQRASCFIYPSIAEKGETFGLAPLEAMSWGCVPIVSSLSCFQDFIEHRKNGLIFDHRKADCINDLSNLIFEITENIELRNSLAQEAIKVSKSHSIETISKTFLTSFEMMTTQSN